MRKTFQDHSHTSIKQTQLLTRIFHNPNPLLALDHELTTNPQTTLLLQISDEERINRIRDYLLCVLEQAGNQLENGVKLGLPVLQVQDKILKILGVQRKLHKNITYRKQLGTMWGPTFLRVLVWSSKMALSEEVLRIISDLSFDKSLKLYYYYFKYYMSHLNLFYPDEIKIKHLYIHNSHLHFGFIRHQQPYHLLNNINNTDQKQQQNNVGQSYIIDIPDLKTYFMENQLEEPNHFTGACLINRKYGLGLSQDDEIFQALMVKVKFLLSEDKNSSVRATIYANWVFGSLDLEFVQSEKKVIGMPDIFELPPDYAGIIQELIQLFFEPTATPETHLLILTFIDTMLALEQKKGHRDFFMSLNENTSALLKLIESLINAISKDQPQGQDGLMVVEKIPIQTVRNREVVEKFVFLICKQIVEATEIQNLAEELATLIFTKKTNITVSEKTIQLCGQILITVETDEQQLLNFAISQIKNQKQQAHSYLKILNMFFSTKHIRQRRDLTLIARSITESQIFTILLPIIKAQCKSENMDQQALLFSAKSFAYTTIILMENICSENPSLVDTIAKYQVLTVLLEFLNTIGKVDDYQCINAINFIHYICLKEGEVRNKVLTRFLETFIRRLLMSNLYEYINYKNFSILSMTLIKLISNIPAASLCVYFGICQALKDLNSEYKQLKNTQKFLQPNTPVTDEHLRLVQQFAILDGKLIIMVKLIEKCREQIFSRTKVSWLYIMYRRLIKLCFVRTYSLIDFPGETRMMVNLIHDLRVLCQRKLKKKAQQEAEKNSTQNLRVINFEEGGQIMMDENMVISIEHIDDEELEDYKRDDEPELKNLSSQEDKDEGNQIGLLDPEEIQKQQEKGKQNQDKQKEKQKIALEKLKEKQKEREKISQQNITKSLEPQNRNIKQLNFLNFAIKNICKTLKQCFEHPSYSPTRMPRRVIEILSTEPYITTQIYLQLKISISVSKIDRLIFYLIKQLLQQSCKDPSYTEMCMNIQSLLPHFVDLISQANVEFLTKNLPFLRQITISVKYETRSSRKSVLSGKKMKAELNGRPKDKLMYYYGFLISVMKCIGMSTEKQGEGYIQKLVKNVIVPFNGYVVRVMREIQEKGVEQITLLQVQKLKNIIKMYLQLFCAQKKRSRQFNIFTPYNHIFMHYLLHTITSPSNSPTIPQLITQILTTLTQLNTTDLQEFLPDTPENRVILVRRVEMKCIVEWAQEFVTRVFDFHVESHVFQQQIQARMRTEQGVEDELGEDSVQEIGRYLMGTDEVVEREERRQAQDAEKNRLQKQKKQVQHNILLFSIYKSFDQFSQMRKTLLFHNPTHLTSLNKIRTLLMSKFSFFIAMNPEIQATLANNPVSFSEELIAKVRANGGAFTEKEFETKMEGLIKEMFQWMVEKSWDCLTEKDTLFMMKASEKINVEETKGISDNVMKVKIVGKKKFQQFCEEIILISKRLFTNYTINWHFSKYITKEMKKSVDKKLAIQQKTNTTLSIKQNVQKLANIIHFFAQQMDSQAQILVKELIEERYTTKFVRELVKFVSEVIGNYESAEGDDKYTEEANALAKEIINFLEEYFMYMEEEERYKAELKKQKRKLKRITKGEVKKSKNQRRKRKRKQLQEMEISSLNPNEQSQSFMKSPEHKSRESRSLRRDRSQQNLNYKNNRLETPRSHLKKRKQTKSQTKKQTKHPKKHQKLSKQIQHLLINILASSQHQAYLNNTTLNSVTDFIIDYMPKGQENHKQKDKKKKKIELDIAEILPYLLRVRICEGRQKGYFHKLALIGFYLMENLETRVNLELGIKRIFFEEGSKEIPMKQWVKRMDKMENMDAIKMSQLGYLVQIKKPKAKQTAIRDKKSTTVFSINLNRNNLTLQQQLQHQSQQGQQPALKPQELQPQKKNPQPQQKQYQLLPYTEQSYRKHKTDRQATILLTPSSTSSSDLNLLHLNLLHHGYQAHVQANQPHLSAAKEGSAIKERKVMGGKSLWNFVDEDGITYVPIKAVEYVPNRNLQVFIYELIDSFMRLIVRGMEEVDERNEPHTTNQDTKMQSQTPSNPQPKNIQIFNLTILCEAFIVLMKESPCIVPYITKYKCRKIILKHIEPLSKKSKTLISNLLNLETKKEITFLAFLIRAGCPLSVSTNFNLIFTMCLDSTVLQKEKMIHDHRSGQEQVPIQHHSSVQQIPQVQPTLKTKALSGTNIKPEQQQGANTQQSFVTFGHVVRQKTLAQLQECFAEEGCFTRRISTINLMTKLLSIKQFSKLCIETPHFIKNLQRMYVDTLNTIKAKKLPQMSIIAKKLLIPFYTNPITILLQINISLQLQKKQKKKPPRIVLRLLREQIEQQMTPAEFFHATKFKQNWPFTTVAEIAYNLSDQHIQDYDLSDSSDSSQQQDGSNDSQSQLNQQQIQQFLQDAADMDDAHSRSGASNASEQLHEREMLQDDGSLGGHDQYTNSWINYDTVMDDLIGIDEEEEEGEDDEGIQEENEDQDEEGLHDDDDDDDEGDQGGDGTIQIDFFPHGEEDEIIEQQLQDQQLDGQQDQDNSGIYRSQQLQQHQESPSHSPHLHPPAQSLHLDLQSASSFTSSSEPSQSYQHLRLDGSPDNLYKYFNEINQNNRDQHRNFIYRTEAEQDQFILLLLSIYVRWMEEGKQDHKYEKKQDKMYQKINPDDIHLIEDHDKCLIGLVDNFDLLAFAEHIEYQNYSKYSEHEWQMPPGTLTNISQAQSTLENDQYLMDNILGGRGRLRNRLIMMEDNGGGNAGSGAPGGGLGDGRVRNRRNAILLANNPNMQADMLARIRTAENNVREMEWNAMDPSSENRVEGQVIPFRQRINRNQQQGQQIQEIREGREGEEAEIQPAENISSELDDDAEGIDNMMLPEHEGLLMGLDEAEIGAALQTQGFSLETFMELPADLQADILQNIRDQASLNQQFGNNPNPAQRIPAQNTNLQQNLHQAQPNTPVRELNTPVRQPNPRFDGHRSLQLQPQPSQSLNPNPNNNNENTEHYKKLSNHHLKKVNKDIIYLLNRDGRNNGRYFDSNDQFIESVLELMHILSENDFIYFPFNLIACMCINSNNESKILSNLQAILLHGPNYLQTRHKLPYTILTNNQSEYMGNYSKHGYTSISLKILYLLLNLSKSYSISISMLYSQNRSTHNMNTEGIEERLRGNTLLQNLMGLLTHEHIRDNLINLEYLLGIVKNVTVIRFNYHVHMLLNKEKKDREKDGQGKEKEKQKIDRAKDASLQLTEQNNSLLFSLLESDFLKQNAHTISKIIMRLSLDQKNLDNFVHYFKKIIRSLALKITKSLTETFQKYGSSQSIPHRLSYKDKLYKSYSEPLIVRLMMIFYEIIKSMKKSIKPEDKNTNLLEDFRQILECEEVKELCERGCDIIEKNPSSSQLLPKIHEFIDCFFAIFNILGDKDERQNEKAQKNNKLVEGTQLGRRTSIKRKFSSNFIDLETLFEKKLCTPQGKAFINANIRNKLNSVLKGSRRFKQSLFDAPIILVALQTPHMLQFDNKKSLFKVQIKRLKQKKSYGTVYLTIDRKDVFQQSFSQLMNRKADELKGKLKIEFQGEQGEDVGGLTREWFQLLSKQMFNPNYALFIPSSTGSTYQPYSKSYVNGDHLNYFKFIGRVMGKALHDGFLLDAFFTPAFYKHILGLPITFKDMEEEDFQYYKSLKWILENSPIEDYMQLNFTYEFDNFGQTRTENLVPNGDQIQVTDENKIEYVQLISHARMAKSVQKQYENLLQGFHQFIPAKLVRIFDEKELEIMISGLPTVDIEDLRRNTDLVNYDKNDKVIVWLFEVLESFDMSLRTAFVQFVTGTSRVPPEGFKALQGFNGAQKFNIHKYYDVKHLPRSHTCFNQLDLPPYESKQMLIQKLTLAITEGKEGFGML